MISTGVIYVPFVLRRAGSSKISHSFFYRRHASVKRKLHEMTWNHQLPALVQLTSLDRAGYERRGVIMEELEQLIREEYHDAKVMAFGSCVTWLADMNADLDVFVDAFG